MFRVDERNIPGIYTSGKKVKSKFLTAVMNVMMLDSSAKDSLSGIINTLSQLDGQTNQLCVMSTHES